MSDQTPKQYIRIPAPAWNAYEAYNTRSWQAAQEPKIKLKIKLKSASGQSSRKPQDGPRKPERIVWAPPAAPPSNDCNCNIKPSGATPPRNDDPDATPCLHYKCKSCREYWLDLMPDEYKRAPWDNPYPEPSPYARPKVEPVSPEIDPRILDGTWRTYQPSPVASPSPSPPWHVRPPILTPVDKSFPSMRPLRSALLSVPQPSYDMFLPTGLVNQTIASGPARTVWRTEPLKRLTVVLKAGKKLGEWVKARERKQKKRVYDREYRARKKVRFV